MVSLDAEVPCRDTDPCAGSNNKDPLSPDTALSFTIDFGEGEGDSEEKARKFERFALRSSQRKVKSPRQDLKPESVVVDEEKTGDEEMQRTCGVRAAWQPGREKSDLEKGGTGGTRAEAGAGAGAGVMRREKSDISKVVRREKSDLTKPARGVSSRGAGSKSDRKSDSASLASMMASLGGGVELLELGDCYDGDSFDEESEEEEEEERALSETGTYVLDKEEEEKQKARSRDLLRLGEENVRPSVESKTSYVAEWAARHGTILPEARHTAVLPEARHTAVLPESRHTTEETLSLEEGRRRRLLPVTPASNGSVSPESAPSSLSPRVKQISTTSQLAQPPFIPASSHPARTSRDTAPALEAAEAWRRRKNYKPLAPGGTKTESAKTGSSSGRSGSRVSQLSSAPGSARSASSESSGYHSRAASATQPKTGLTKSAPSRSISSLTSKEAEFQAWRRRKNYRPGQPSSSSASVKKTTVPSSSSSSSGISQSASKSSECKSRVAASPSSGAAAFGGEGMQRANSFHYENKRLAGSSAMARVQESGDEVENDFYLDGDELIMPVYPRQPRHHEKYKCESFSHEREPSSRSRTADLDNLVISTLHNVSSKLCITSSDILRKAAKLIPEANEDQSVTVETVQYLLEDTDLPTSPKKRTSRELSGTLKNLKKLEQVLDILNTVLEQPDTH